MTQETKQQIKSIYILLLTIEKQFCLLEGKIEFQRFECKTNLLMLKIGQRKFLSGIQNLRSIQNYSNEYKFYKKNLFQLQRIPKRVKNSLGNDNNGSCVIEFSFVSRLESYGEIMLAKLPFSSDLPLEYSFRIQQNLQKKPLHYFVTSVFR